MSYKIGFMANFEKEEATPEENLRVIEATKPVKSLVQIYFPERNMTLAYYNDKFDLKRGDLVYVDGKLKGLQGRVVDVIYNFKIKLSDYKRVIGFADTTVRGEFNIADSHMVTFDKSALPFEKVMTWFKTPEDPDEEYAFERGGAKFPLNNLQDMNISSEIAERGQKYYTENNVVYIELSGKNGRAIVEGGIPYTVEFEYDDGMISDLVCDCFCVGACKHQFAAMLQLRETLDIIEKNYRNGFKKSNYFALISKRALFTYAFSGKQTGTVILK